MTKEIQQDLFIESKINCECEVKHALTRTDFEIALKQISRIRKLILDHGWNLSKNYYHHMDKLSNNCNVWDLKNSPYLVLRSLYQEEVKTIAIPLERKN